MRPIKTETSASLIVTATILVAAAMLGTRKDSRLRQVEKRLETARAGTRETGPQAVRRLNEPAKTARDKETRRSAEALMEWLATFRNKENPHLPVTGVDALELMYDRLERLTSAEARFILNEYLKERGIDGFPWPLLFKLCLTKLATDDPLEAIRFFDEFRKKWKNWEVLREMGTLVIGDAVVAMAKDDPDQAAEWLRVNRKKFDGQISEHTKRVMLFHIARKDPAKAFNMIAELEMGGAAEAAGAIVRAAGTDEERSAMLAALRRYEKGFSDEAVKSGISEQAFKAFGERLSAQGANAAARWVEAERLGESEIDGLLAAVVGKRSLGEPGSWIDWIGKTVSPEKADGHVRKLFSLWTEEDYRAAGHWLVAAPQGETREMAVQAYAEKVSAYDPEAAGQWAETLPPGKRREDTIRKVHENWPVNDSNDIEAAAAFARRNGMGE